MNGLKLLVAGAAVAVLVGGCTPTVRAGATASPLTSRLQTVNGLEVEFIAADWRGGPDLWATICYQLPSDADWVPGRLPTDATITGQGTSAVMSGLELVGRRASPDGKKTNRCDRLQFSLSDISPNSSYTLTIERIAASLPKEPDWTEIQRRLDAAATGIKIEPIPGQEGLSFALKDKPANMSDTEASNVVVDIAGDVVRGPWVFSFSIPE